MNNYVHVEQWFFTRPNGSRHLLKDVEDVRKALKEGKPVFALTSTGTTTPPIEKILLNGRKFRVLGGSEYRIV